ncbi:tetratricopeptide repeat protein [Geodermatophilus poikilotrophus]|uniref:tetratricopeptide repeat protein n=1 Tax=Geodermatophilus poikilotrophus TaxID=1333667 RepID=UPI001587D44F|nr:tetratricopeptide repeat protein [Geodermatophilus poikilotrophus]
MNALQRQIGALREAGAATELSALGLELLHAEHFPEAEMAFLAARDLGEMSALTNLAVTLDRMNRTEEAEAAYREAIEAGHDEGLVQLADMLLFESSRTSEVEAMLRLAVTREAVGAWYVLGKLLARRLGRHTEAEDALRRERNSEIRPLAQYELGCLLVSQPGREEDAATALRASGTAAADGVLGRLLLGLPGRESDAVAALRRAAEGGVAHGWNNLTVVLAQFGRLAEADAAYRDGIAAGEWDLVAHYGDFLQVHGRVAEAEEVLRRGLEKDARCAFILGVILVNQPGRADEGRRLLRLAAGSGVAEAGAYLARAGR